MSVTTNIQTASASQTYAFHFADDSQPEVQLADGRFTIGAGEDCNLQLPEPGGRPIQSLVVMGPGGVMIRNMRPDALLNGNFFRDAILKPGDRLCYGETEFELVQLGAENCQAASEPNEPVSESAVALQEAAAQIMRLRNDLQQAKEELATVKHQAETATSESSNNETIEAELAAAREQLQQERAEAEAVLRAERDRLEQQAAELQAEKAALANAPAPTLEDPLHEREAKIAQREQQLADAVAREQAELDSQREQLEQDRERLQQERELARAEIEQERSAAAPLPTEVAEETPVEVFAPEPTTEEFESPTAVVEETVEESPVDMAHGSEPTHEATEESKNESARAAEEALARIKAAGIFKDSPESLLNESPVEDPFNESPAEEPPAYEQEEPPAKATQPAESLGDAAPVSFIDQYAGSFEEEEEDFAPVEPIAPPTPEPAPVPTAAPQGNAEDDHESSIEDYMAQLMQRMQGGPAAPAPAAPRPSTRVAEKKVEKPKVEKPVEEPQEVLQASEYKPRSSAPEQTSNLAAMRDLANQSARTAIKTSSKKMRWAYAGARIGMALFFFGVGAVMLYMTNSLFSPIFLGSLVTIIGGGVLCYQAAQVVAGKDPHAVKKQKQNRKSKDQFEEEEEE